MSTLNVTLIQADLAWHDAEENRECFGRTIAALDQPTDLIVLPEMFTTGFTMDAEVHAETMGGTTLAWMRQQAAARDAAVCGSVIVTEAGCYYNRFLFVRPDGSHAQYDKRHLFGVAGEDRHYRAGTEPLLIDWRGFRLNAQVCYDLRFPVWSRNRRSDPYDLLIYVANWPSRRHNAWATLLRARAIENLSFVAGVNRCGTDGNELPYAGGSAAIDYLGATLADLGRTAGIASVTLDRDALLAFREKFPFDRDADEFRLLRDAGA